MAKIFVSYSDNSLKKLAQHVCAQLDLPMADLITEHSKMSSKADYFVNLSERGLSFISSANIHGAIRCDFVSGSHRHRRSHGGGNGQMIAKAVGVSGKFCPNVLDLTAGLGSDGFVLASLGCRVQLLERNPIVYRLLKDGLERAKLAAIDDADLAAITDRISLAEINSAVYLDSLDTCANPDVIYMDPMFPPRKKSAQVKKEMQALHQIVGKDEDADLILKKALEKAIYRVVVKRPAHAEYLDMIEPSYSLKGKSTRYDIFAKQKLPK